jgi:uncharacterized protein YecE (DUF72 family)
VAPRGLIRIGCAGWNIPKHCAPLFPREGTQLQRYATRFDTVEIDSSFRQSHRLATYERWAHSVPNGFAFALKAPQEITHRQRLREASLPLDLFLAQARGLGHKLGPLLFQLPPSLGFERQPVAAFFAELRARLEGHIVCEPRHRGWFTDEAEQLMSEHRVSRAAADPAIMPRAGVPGGWMGLAYHRLHGSPRMYYSAYGRDELEKLAGRLTAYEAGPCWVIFDNTAAGAATANALALQELLEEREAKGA